MAAVSPVMQALYEGRRDEAEDLAREQELDVFEATALGRNERLAALLRADPGLAHARSPDGFTALHYAAFFQAPEAARLLVAHGATVDAVAENPMKVTPLHSAAAARQLEVARLLLEHGASPAAKQEGGFTALHAAAQNGHQELVDVLLDHGADKLAESDEGKTAADFAADAGRGELAARLRA